MRNFNVSVITLAVGLAFSVGAIAENMSREQYKSLQKNLEVEYKSAKLQCKSLSGNANDICMAHATGNKNIAKAELEASYKPSVQTRYDARVARAEADYSIANEKCDDQSGTGKDICVEEAKAAKVHQLADAKAQMKTSDANAVADEKSADANANAAGKVADAHKDAAVDKRNADYAVAKEKCQVLAGGAKDVCLNKAKVRYGQQ